MDQYPEMHLLNKNLDRQADPLTVSEALAEAVPRLTDAGVDTPRLDAHLLLAWTLKARREDLAREPERPLTGREQIIFAKAIDLRAARRPLPYITGEAPFYGRMFKVNRAVLIPRPETEGVIEAALRLCNGQAAPSLADIGTGSGCLAVTLACERPDAEVWATDLSENALREARKNVRRHGVESRVTLTGGDSAAALPPGKKFSGIVSNPPYIAEAERGSLPPEVRDYEPPLALFGSGPEGTGPDGTGLHRRLLQDAPAHLHPGGFLLLEVGQGQAPVVAAFARACGYAEVTVLDDFAGIGRIVSAKLS